MFITGLGVLPLIHLLIALTGVDKSYRSVECEESATLCAKLVMGGHVYRLA